MNALRSGVCTLAWIQGGDPELCSLSLLSVTQHSDGTLPEVLGGHSGFNDLGLIGSCSCFLREKLTSGKGIR